MRTPVLLLLATGFCAAQQPRIDRVAERGPIASGTWISIYGAGLAQSTREWQTADFNGTGLPTKLDGVSVHVNGIPAPVAYISPAQIKILVPSPIPNAIIPIVVTTAEGASAPMTTFVQPVAPTWVSPDAFHADGRSVDFINPALPGESLVVYGSGFVRPVTAIFDVDPATIEFVGPIGLGLDQINFVVPTGATTGRYYFHATADGIESPRLYIPIERPDGPPVLMGLAPNDFIWGQTASVTLLGDGLTKITAVHFSDPSQLTLDGTPGNYRLTLSVEGTAVPGQRTVSVTTPAGVSAFVPFTIRRGEPRITSLSPATVWPGRVYPFAYTGEDIAAVTSVEMTPGAGIQTLVRTLVFDSHVAAGPIQVRLKTPWDTSPPVEMQVVPAPAAAPTLHALSPIELRRYNAMIPLAFSERADYIGEIEFTDTDGDTRAGSTIEMVVDTGGGTTTSSGKITLLAKPGAARFTITHFARLSRNGPFRVWITLIDEAGNRSNAMPGTILELWQ